MRIRDSLQQKQIFIINISIVHTWPQSWIRIRRVGIPVSLPYVSICLITSIPSTTWPNTTFLPFNHGHGRIVTKNCDVFVFGPSERENYIENNQI